MILVVARFARIQILNQIACVVLLLKIPRARASWDDDFDSSRESEGNESSARDFRRERRARATKGVDAVASRRVASRPVVVDTSDES